MKTTLTTILILITLSGFTQPLMVGFRKADVISNMRNSPGYTRTVKALDYLEYERNNRAYGFRFERDSLNLYRGRWICTEFYITVLPDDEQAYLNNMIACNCLTPVDRDLWLWVNDYDTVTVTRIEQDGSVTFVWR